MKTNGHYAGLPAAVNDLKPEQAGAEMVTQFRMEPAVLDAYAEYFCRYLRAYREEGVTILAVHVQNEPNSCQNFPSCVWRPEDLATFIADYLGPRLRDKEPRTLLWLGTVERPQLERVNTILDSKARSYLSGVGMQWAGKGVVAELHRTHPALPLMQTESECGDGSNDWAAARHTWDLMHHYLTNGACAYMYWNLVLDETGSSRWGWRQNALVTVDRSTRQVRFNPEYYLMMHFSRFVQRRASFLKLPAGAGEPLAFVNPDGRHVLVLSNPAATPLALQVRLSGKSYALELPPQSFATLVE
jgi:glucosylceramidase